MTQSKYWTWLICFSYLGTLIISTEISLTGSEDYIVPERAFKLNCYLSKSPRIKTAYFYKDNIAVLNVIYVDAKNTCYGVLQMNNKAFICENNCSCSLDFQTYTWTYSGLTQNKSATFKCEIDIGTDKEQLTFSELSVERAYGPSFVSLYPDSQLITKNETDLVEPIHCISDCVPNCTYSWSGPGISSAISVLQIPNIRSNRSGTYTCTASNTYINETSTVDLEIRVQYGPDSIIFNPSNVSYNIEEGTNVGPVDCSSPSCYPVCKHEWAGPGISDKSNRLHLINIQRGQTGQFTCTASNVVSRLLKKMNITVEYRPSNVVLNPNRSEIVVNEFDEIGPVHCSADCVPSCTYIWKGTGMNENIPLLQIVNISRTQNGTYTCIAKNGYGEHLKILNIVVQFGPDNITFNPLNESYTVEESTTFGPINCTSSCFPLCEHKWIGSGIREIKDQLSFKKISRNNTGTFACTASNNVGYVQKEITIIVEYGPLYVFVNPSLSTIMVNESDQLGPINCTADCVPACSYLWTGPGKNEHKIGLKIENISRDQNGTFTCTAKNGYGEKTVDINIVVQYGPSVVTVKPLNKTYTIKEFDSLDPIVCFSSCVPSCSFYWTGPTISELKRNPLHLTNAQRNQTGNYTCTTYNDVGVAHVRITITVLFAARVIYVNTSQGVYEVNEYSNITFVCGAEGLPIPEMSWYYVNTNGTRKLLNTTNSIQTQHDISVVECSDTGTYICEANNALFPLSNKSRDLNVTCAPRLQNSCSSRRLIAVKNNATLSLTACFLSNPVPNVNWTLVNANSSTFIRNDFNGVYQNSSILYTAILETQLINTRQKKYDVYAYNSVGKSNIVMFTVIVEDKPFPPQDVMVTCKEINTLYWTSNFNGGSEQVFQVIYFENNITAIELPENIADTDDGKPIQIVLKNLNPNKHYTFQVIALNKFNRTASKSVYCFTAAPSSGNDTNISGVIGGIAGTTLAILITVIGIVVFWKKRRNTKHNADAEKKGRKKLTPKKKEDEEDDGLKDNILYESAGHDFIRKQEPIGAEYATVAKNIQLVKFNGDGNIQETALYSEVMKNYKHDQNADVYTSVVKSKNKHHKHKGKKMESREDVYEDMSGEVGNVASNYPTQQFTNKDGLVYVDLILNASPNGPRFIHGIDDRTIYADVDLTEKVDPLPDSASDEENTNENNPKENNTIDRNID